MCDLSLNGSHSPPWTTPLRKSDSLSQQLSTTTSSLARGRTWCPLALFMLESYPASTCTGLMSATSTAVNSYVQPPAVFRKQFLCASSPLLAFILIPQRWLSLRRRECDTDVLVRPEHSTDQQILKSICESVDWWTPMLYHILMSNYILNCSVYVRLGLTLLPPFNFLSRSYWPTFYTPSKHADL